MGKIHFLIFLLKIIKNIEGVIAYFATTGVAVRAGEPVCSDENMPFLITEFMIFCKQNNLDICFCQTLEKHIPWWKRISR
jgi:lysylphosphatidylglycerol synthetase-like protein (DUF2156 family)